MHRSLTPRPARARGLARLGAAASAALVALALAACSSGGDATADAGAGSPTSGASAEPTTQTVHTPKGDVVVPTHPLRVVSVHSYTTEALYDLGVTPVGVENGGAEYVPPRYLERWTAAPKVTDGGEIDLEKIASLKPDLIIGVDVPYLDSAYKKLAQIAPTVFEPFTDATTWVDYPTATAPVVGADEQLAALKTKYDSEIARVKSTYADELATLKWDVVQGGFDAGNYWIYGPGSDVGTVLTEIGAQFASATAGVDGGNTKSVSYEKADLLSDADEIVYYTNNDGTPANNIDKLFALPAFKNLAAAKADHLVGTADFLPGSYSDALGLLDSIETALKAAQTTAQ